MSAYCISGINGSKGSRRIYATDCGRLPYLYSTFIKDTLNSMNRPEIQGGQKAFNGRCLTGL